VHPQTHALASWLVGRSWTGGTDAPRSTLVLAAGLAPDLDALSLLGGVHAYQKWHHLVFHNVAGAAITAVVCVALARSRLPVLVLSASVVSSAPIIRTYSDQAGRTVPYGRSYSCHSPLASSSGGAMAARIVAECDCHSLALFWRVGEWRFEADAPSWNRCHLVQTPVVVEILKRRWPF